jgi:hypothetical protein
MHGRRRDLSAISKRPNDCANRAGESDQKADVFNPLPHDPQI